MKSFLLQLRNAALRNPKVTTLIISAGLGAIGVNIPPEIIDMFLRE